MLTFHHLPLLFPTQCFVGDLRVKLFFVEGRGGAFTLEKQGHDFFNLLEGIKNKLECVMIGRGQEEGLQTPIAKSRSRNSSFDLYEKVKNQLECITIGRGKDEGFKNPENLDTNCYFDLHGVNSRGTYNNSSRSTRVGPQANHVKDVMGHFRLFYAIFPTLFN